MTSSAELQNLPLELFYEIVEYLDYAPRLALRLSCRGFHVSMAARLPTAPAHSRGNQDQYSMSDLLEIEKWPIYHGAAAKEGRHKQPTGTHNYFALRVTFQLR